MQFHCFSDLQITMEIVFPSSPPHGCPRAGKRSQRKAAGAGASCRLQPAAAAGSWRVSRRCPLKRCGERRREWKEGEKAPPRMASPRRCPVEPPCALWGRGAGASSWRRLGGKRPLGWGTPRPLGSPGWQRVGLPRCLRRKQAEMPGSVLLSAPGRRGRQFYSQTVRVPNCAMRDRLGVSLLDGFPFWIPLPFTLPILLPGFGLVHCN